MSSLYRIIGVVLQISAYATIMYQLAQQVISSATGRGASGGSLVTVVIATAAAFAGYWMMRKGAGPALASHRPCPHCSGLIHQRALACGHCGRDVAG